MSFVSQLAEEANYTRTLNGAKTHASTGDACLDLFATAGGMRYSRPEEQIRRFDRAYIENPELAMKLLFHIRDARKGIGERGMFRTLIRHVAQTWPESAQKNVRYIAEYGRWDDLMCLLGTAAQGEVIRVIRLQLDADLAALERRANGEDPDAHISLCAKWLPSSNTSSARTRSQAQTLMRAMRMNEREYRRVLKNLRAAVSVTERHMTLGNMDRVNYEAVPAGAMLKYRKAFSEKDTERYTRFLADVKAGEKSVHADTLFPYQILRPYFEPGYARKAAEPETLEALWNSLPVSVSDQNAISVIDTSGSMYCGYGQGKLTPALVAQSLGLYHAERCKGPFRNTFITFSSWPELIQIHGRSLEEKLRYIGAAPWGWSTNMEAVFDLILTTALKANAAQEDMPEVLYIISDMEFNCAVRDPDKTVYDNAKELYEAYGYKLPAVVFQNVNSWQMQAPVTAHTRGAALSSGAGTHTFSHKFDGNSTPMSHMLRVLNGERYACIHA